MAASDYLLPLEEKCVLKQAFNVLQTDLNTVVSVLRESVDGKLGGTVAEFTAVSELNKAMETVRTHFEQFAREFDTLYTARQSKKITPSHVSINNYGSAGVIGINGTMSGGRVSQSSGATEGLLDFSKLVKELQTLQQSLRSNAVDLEQKKAVLEIIDAEDAAQREDLTALSTHLKAAGKWAFDVATKIGTTVAAAAIGKALN